MLEKTLKKTKLTSNWNHPQLDCAIQKAQHVLTPKLYLEKNNYWYIYFARRHCHQLLTLQTIIVGWKTRVKVEMLYVFAAASITSASKNLQKRISYAFSATNTTLQFRPLKKTFLSILFLLLIDQISVVLLL